jgi:hypothetical protein
MVCVNRERLAWAAGFFDGEGNTNAFRRPPAGTYNIQMSVTQIHVDTLVRFQSCLGGIGRLHGPYITKTPGTRPQYEWRLGGFEQVQAGVAMLWEWLTPHKREQAADALLKFRSTWAPKSQWMHRRRVRLGQQVLL